MLMCSDILYQIIDPDKIGIWVQTCTVFYYNQILALLMIMTVHYFMTYTFPENQIE